MSSLRRETMEDDSPIPHNSGVFFGETQLAKRKPWSAVRFGMTSEMTQDALFETSEDHFGSIHIFL